MNSLLTVLLFPFLLVWRVCCLVVMAVMLIVGLVWGFVIPSAAKKPEAETTVEESFEEDFPTPEGIEYEWMKKPRHELSTTQKFKRLRMAYSRQMFTPVTPKVRASWFAAQRQ